MTASDSCKSVARTGIQTGQQNSSHLANIGGIPGARYHPSVQILHPRAAGALSSVRSGGQARFANELRPPGERGLDFFNIHYTGLAVQGGVKTGHSEGEIHDLP